METTPDGDAERREKLSAVGEATDAALAAGVRGGDLLRDAEARITAHIMENTANKAHAYAKVIAARKKPVSQAVIDRIDGPDGKALREVPQLRAVSFMTDEGVFVAAWKGRDDVFYFSEFDDRERIGDVILVRGRVGDDESQITLDDLLERTDGVFDTRVGGSPFQNAAALTHRFHIGAERTARTKISDDARTKLADQLGL